LPPSVRTDFTKCVSLGVFQPVVYYSLLPTPSKAEQSLRDLHFNPIFSKLKNGWGFKNNQTIKQTTKQPNNQAKTDEHH
jgi:hypothetical protein